MMHGTIKLKKKQQSTAFDIQGTVYHDIFL